MRQWLRMTWLGLCGVFPIAAGAQASTLYVNALATTGANDGSSWADAFQGTLGLQNALAAAVSGDSIWVARGTYLPSATLAQSASFALKSGVGIYGGFAGIETALEERDVQANETILSGDLAGDDALAMTGENSNHVVTANAVAAGARLDGFTVQGGNARGPSVHGGGLAMNGSSPTIAWCRFRANHADGSGGAISVTGGIPVIVDCRFESNSAAQWGGGVVTFAGAVPRIDRCVFRGNSAGKGTAFFAYSNSVPQIHNSLFYENFSVPSGVGQGAAIALESGQLVEITNCTIAFNTTGGQTGGIETLHPGARITNCIVFWNQVAIPGLFHQVCCDWADVRYSCVAGNAAGVGNTDTPPAFANPSAGDFRLAYGSPCIDRGDNSALLIGSLDLARNVRFVDDPDVADGGAGSAPVIDMGAFEAHPSANVPFCFGDGTGAACPCGNESILGFGEGCLHSFGLGGRLVPAGNARISLDSLALVGTRMTNAFALYFQGTLPAGGGSGVVFGDGLLCASGATVRLGAKLNVSGASQYPEAGDVPISVRTGAQAGATYAYQTYFRNIAAFCTPAGFNLTNGVLVTWVP